MELLEHCERNEREDPGKDVIVNLRPDVVHPNSRRLSPGHVDNDVEPEQPGVELPVHVTHTRVATCHVDTVPIDGVLNDVGESPRLPGFLPFHDTQSHSGL